MRKALPALLFLLALSCSPPPFNEWFIQTSSIASKMTKEAVVGSSTGYWESWGVEVFYYPIMASGTGVDCTRGFIHAVSASNSILLFTYPGTDGYHSFQAEGYYFPSPNPDPARTTSMVLPLKTGDCLDVINYASPSASPLDNTYEEFFMVDAPGQTFARTERWFTNIIGLIPGIAATDRLLGITVPPSLDPLGDNCYMLIHLGAGPSIVESYFAIRGTNGLSTTPNTIRVTPDSQLPFLAGINRCQYYHNVANGRSYACIKAGSGWETYVWYDDSGVKYYRMIGIDARIDGLLSTGELFSTQDGVFRLFSAEGQGSETARFPLYGLRIAYEAYSNGTARVYFTMPYTYAGNLQINVYSVLSTGLAALGTE